MQNERNADASRLDSRMRGNERNWRSDNQNSGVPGTNASNAAQSWLR